MTQESPRIYAFLGSGGLLGFPKLRAVASGWETWNGLEGQWQVVV